MLDALSAVYYLRAARLAPGDRLCFDVIASRRFWRFEGTVAEAMEEVETPAGASRRCGWTRSPAAPTARIGPGRFTSGSLATRRLLVAAVSETELGFAPAPVRARRATALKRRRGGCRYC